MTDTTTPLEAFVSAVEEGDEQRAGERARAVAEAYRQQRAEDTTSRVRAARAVRARERLSVPMPDSYGRLDDAAVDKRRQVDEYARREGSIGAARATFLGRAHA